MLREVKQFETYRHFKGGFYVVIAVGKFSEQETHERIVTYVSMGNPEQMWSRPYSDFISLVPEDRASDQKYRFEKVEDFQSPLSILSVSTIIEELKKRPDNPFKEHDLFKGSVVDKSFRLCSKSVAYGTPFYTTLEIYEKLDSVKERAQDFSEEEKEIMVVLKDELVIVPWDDLT